MTRFAMTIFNKLNKKKFKLFFKLFLSKFSKLYRFATLYTTFVLIGGYAYFCFLLYRYTLPAHAQELSATATYQPQPKGTAVDDIAAIINNDVLTERELDERIALIKHRLQQRKLALPPSDALRQQVLEQMVLERIQLQRAKEVGITVDAAAVNQALERLAQANHLSVDQYRARLEREGGPWAIFMRDLEHEWILTQLRQKEVDSQIVVSDAEVENYLAHHPAPIASASNDSASQREAVRQALGMQKAEQAYIDWLRTLRDRATVQYSLRAEQSS